jgi:hypothetical protein
MPLHRILGTVGMVTSPFLFFSFAAADFDQEATSRLASACGLVFSLGWLASVAGLALLRAAGPRRPGRVILALPLVTVPFAVLTQVYELIDPDVDNALYATIDVCWPLSMLLLVAGGIAILRAGVWRSWLRFVPLAAGLWLPVALLTQGLLGETAGQVLGGLHVTIGWLLLGYAVHNAGVPGFRR